MLLSIGVLVEGGGGGYVGVFGIFPDFYKTLSIKLQKRQKKQVQIRMWSYDQTDTHTPTQVMTPTSTPHVNI
jgi:hypothetical protein